MSGEPHLTPVPEPPADRLRALIGPLDESGWPFELFDPEWRLVWVSREMRALLGEAAEAQEHYGLHVFESRWEEALTRESELRWTEANLPYILHAAGLEDGAPLAEELEEEDFRALFRRARPAPPPPAWRFDVDFIGGEGPPLRVDCVGMTVRGDDGAILGYLLSYGPGLPATIFTMLVRGDPEMFARMARLVEPRRTEAAILFADLQASGQLSRRLPSVAYFSLLRALTTAIDQAVISRGGIVGKHAGDGVTAFFVVDDFDSPAAAAAAAIGAGRAIAAAAARAAGEGDVRALLGPDDCAMNVGVHWGAGLYMGQLVTGGRLEVTALGDEVNECARIQECARDGAVLASKPLVERLDPQGARGLGLDPVAVAYEPLGQRAGATEKAVRDAGTLPVADISERRPARG